MLSSKLVSMIVWKNRSSFGTMHPPHGRKNCRHDIYQKNGFWAKTNGPLGNLQPSTIYRSTNAQAKRLRSISRSNSVRARLKNEPAQNGCSNVPTSVAYISCARLHAVIIMCCFKRNHRVRIYPRLQSTHAISIQPQRHSKRGNITLNYHILFRLHDFTIHAVL